jgi:DNA-binding MarR family transcriptional regulator
MSSATAVPFEKTLFVRDNCLCLHIQRAARAIARRFDEALRPVGLTNGQFSLLMSLNRPMPPSMGEVAALLAVDRTTLTAALKPLERRGLIVVKPEGRSRLLALTPAGQSLLSRAVPIWNSTHAALEDGLADPARLRTDLQALSRADDAQ